MKQKFTTSVDAQVLEDFKVLAIRKKKNISAYLEELMKRELEMGKRERDTRSDCQGG